MRCHTCQLYVRFETARFPAAWSREPRRGDKTVNSIERALAILLLLTRGRLVPATDLARRFEVSVRTIYRDIDRLIALGIPVEAERGAEGGFRLSTGFLSPPIALNRVETTALLVALGLMRGLRATPLMKDLESAEAKLLAALPQAAREVLAKGSKLIGIEQTPEDIFHRAPPPERLANQQNAVDVFLQGVLTQRRVEIVHRGSSAVDKLHEIEPHGLLFDRNLWYLVGRSLAVGEIRMWRADRVRSATVTGMAFRPQADFDIATMLGRRWLEQAMRSWAKDGEGTRIRMSREAAERLRRDWYFRHATFAPDGEGIIMSIPDTDAGTILPLVRWLGREAELLAPADLRAALQAELEETARRYADPAAHSHTPKAAAAAVRQTVGESI
jgi:predicted DNA-binding transcriptional regulator YafY